MTDCKLLVDYWHHGTWNLHRTIIAILEDVKDPSPFDYLLVSCVSRACNLIAHLLAHQAFKSKDTLCKPQLLEAPHCTLSYI